MILDCVTFTGADDSVKPEALIDLITGYPFVELGILYSGSRQGLARYPSEQWQARFLRAIVKFNANGEPEAARVCAHLCGRWVRDLVVNGTFTWQAIHREFVGAVFRRCQLNFHGQFHRQHSAFEFQLGVAPAFDSVIFQCDGVNDTSARLLVERGFGVPLFDTSGGAGRLPLAWPKPWLQQGESASRAGLVALPAAYCGYAGGLGPDNVVTQLEAIRRVVPADQRIWIDMERRVRSADDQRFDLDKVHAVCEAVAPYIGQRLPQLEAPAVESRP